MTTHCQWPDVPIRTIVDAILDTATKHGEAEVFVHGNTLRICKPGHHTATEYDQHCGSYRQSYSRAKVTEMLLAAFLLAVTDR